MVRTRVLPLSPRPDNCPLLTFEHFSSEGNSKDAVVYNKPEKTLKYKDNFYLVSYDGFLPGDVIKEVFLKVKDDGKETMIVRYSTRQTEAPVYQKICRQTVVPDLNDEEKLEIFSLLKGYAGEMAREAEQVKASVERMKELYKGLEQSVLKVRPGIVMDEDFNERFLEDSAEVFNTMVESATVVLEYAEDLSTVEPFPAKKRKSCD